MTRELKSYFGEEKRDGIISYVVVDNIKYDIDILYNMCFFRNSFSLDLTLTGKPFKRISFLISSKLLKIEYNEDFFGGEKTLVTHDMFMDVGKDYEAELGLYTLVYLWNSFEISIVKFGLDLVYNYFSIKSSSLNNLNTILTPEILHEFLSHIIKEE